MFYYSFLKENGLENIFPAFFAGFDPGLTYMDMHVALVRTTLAATQLFKSSIGGL